MNDLLSGWMLDVAGAVLTTALVVLLAMLAVVAAQVGGFVRELLERTRLRRAVDEAFATQALEDATPASVAQVLRRAGGLPVRFAAELERRGVDEADRVLVDLEAHTRSRLAPLTFLTRIGPMVGLIATLLPIGPALSALGRNEIDAVASELTLAFTATVLGLVVSCIAYFVGLTRRTWYARDLDDLETLALRLADVSRHRAEAAPHGLLQEANA